MVEHEGVLVSQELFEEEFVCNLSACKGACCKEGEYGAPLAPFEIEEIAQALPAVRPLLTAQAQEVLDQEGFFARDDDDDWVTTLQPNEACIFARQGANAIWACTLEEAYNGGATKFKKPISCHLYPVRIEKVGMHDRLRYDRWEICAPACVLGQKLKVRIWDFVREALIRRYGEEWWKSMSAYIDSKS